MGYLLFGLRVVISMTPLSPPGKRSSKSIAGLSALSMISSHGLSSSARKVFAAASLGSLSTFLAMLEYVCFALSLELALMWNTPQKLICSQIEECLYDWRDGLTFACCPVQIYSKTPSFRILLKRA